MPRYYHGARVAWKCTPPAIVPACTTGPDTGAEMSLCTDRSDIHTHLSAVAVALSMGAADRMVDYVDRSDVERTVQMNW